LLLALDDAVFGTALPVQALHGDASLSNLLRTPERVVWNDFEDTFPRTGPLGRGRLLAPFAEAHHLYGEIWRLYDVQRRAGIR
jgi:hypothetical protein